MQYRGNERRAAHVDVRAYQNGKAILGDNHEHHYYGVTEPTLEGEEIGPCRKCSQMIWINAPRCPRCAYDPAVELAIIHAAHERLRSQRSAVALAEGVMCFFAAVGVAMLLSLTSLTGIAAFKVWVIATISTSVALHLAFHNAHYLLGELLPYVCRRLWHSRLVWCIGIYASAGGVAFALTQAVGFAGSLAFAYWLALSATTGFIGYFLYDNADDLVEMLVSLWGRCWRGAIEWLFEEDSREARPLMERRHD